MTHAELMDKTEEVVTEPSKIKVKLKPENCDVCYPPVFQVHNKGVPQKKKDSKIGLVLSVYVVCCSLPSCSSM